MAHKTEVRAVEMVRRIRDKQAQMLLGKSVAEIIAFFKQAGETVRTSARAMQTSPSLPPKRLTRRSSGRAAGARR